MSFYYNEITEKLLPLLKQNSKRADDIIKKHGDDGIDFYLKHGDDAASYLKKYGDDVIDIFKKYGDDGVNVIRKHGDDAVNAIRKYGDTAYNAISKYGDDAVDAFEKYGDNAAEGFENGKTPEEIKGSTNSAKGLIGHDFEDYLTKNIGGNGSFKVGGREFDGGVGNRWWEAKSGGYWDMLENDPKELGKFKDAMGDRKRIAADNGATYELFSNVPIPDSIKTWLTKKGIPFTEILD